MYVYIRVLNYYGENDEDDDLKKIKFYYLKRVFLDYIIIIVVFFLHIYIT